MNSDFCGRIPPSADELRLGTLCADSCGCLAEFGPSLSILCAAPEASGFRAPVSSVVMAKLHLQRELELNSRLNSGSNDGRVFRLTITNLGGTIAAHR